MVSTQHKSQQHNRGAQIQALDVRVPELFPFDAAVLQGSGVVMVGDVRVVAGVHELVVKNPLDIAFDGVLKRVDVPRYILILGHSPSVCAPPHTIEN